jgi:hypothetical protein
MKTLLFTLALANGGDLASTEYALTRPDIVATELNPLMHHRPVRIALKAGVATAEIVALRHMAKTHPKIAKAYAIGLIAANSYFTVHNLRQVHQARRGQ